MIAPGLLGETEDALLQRPLLDRQLVDTVPELLRLLLAVRVGTTARLRLGAQNGDLRGEVRNGAVGPEADVLVPLVLRGQHTDLLLGVRQVGLRLGRRRGELLNAGDLRGLGATWG